MVIEGCSRGIVLLLLVSSSFSRSTGDTSKTLDAFVDDPAWTSAQHHSPSGVGGRLRRWNSLPEDTVELQNGALIVDEERINEEGLEGANATSDDKESKYGFGFFPQNPFLPQNPFQVFPTTSAPATTPTVAGICQLLAANAGITTPTSLLAFLQQCAVLTGLING